MSLFETNGHKAHLSAKGFELLEASEGLIESMARLEALREASRQTIRTIRMGFTELVTLTWFSAFATSVKAVHPDVSLHPEVDLSACLQKKLLDGDLDLVVIPQNYVTPAMTAIALQSIEFAWLAPARQFTENTTISLKELASWPIIVQGAHSGITQRCEQLFAQAGIEFDHVYGSNSLFALVALVRAGIGVSCLPKDLFADEIERGELQEISVEAPQTIVNYQLAFLKHGQNVLTESLAALASQCVISH